MSDATETVTVQKQEFACENCGATLAFAPGTDTLQCQYCGHENQIAGAAQPALVQEHDFLEGLEKASEGATTQITKTVKCSNCAAEFTFDPNLHADECPFCGTTIVTDTDDTRTIKPNLLLPFKLTEPEARERVRRWIKGLWFAPNKAKQYARTQGKLSGMYVPYWTYDSGTNSRYSGERGIDYQEQIPYTTTVNGQTVTKTRTVTKTHWTPVSGRVSRDFDDVLVLASHTLPPKYTDALEPWDLENLTGYANDYLAGFRSEIYQVDLKNGFDAARGKMAPVIRADVRRDIGGDRQRIHNLNTQYYDISYKHVLLPVWMAAYRYGDKVFRFVVNGRTGEVQGERPYSAVKIALAAIGAIIVIGGAVWLFSVLSDDTGTGSYQPTGTFQTPSTPSYGGGQNPADNPAD